MHAFQSSELDLCFNMFKVHVNSRNMHKFMPRQMQSPKFNWWQAMSTYHRLFGICSFLDLFPSSQSLFFTSFHFYANCIHIDQLAEKVSHLLKILLIQVLFLYPTIFITYNCGSLENLGPVLHCCFRLIQGTMKKKLKNGKTNVN